MIFRPVRSDDDAWLSQLARIDRVFRETGGIVESQQ
jgi:hypothetical protein